MAKKNDKDDFDKIDSNKDGFISREDYANADKSAGVKKEKLNWFLRLITLGDRFDIQDFWDRLKKSIVEFIILVFGVTVSFGIEQQGGESDNRADGIENLLNLREEIDKMIAYTDTYHMALYSQCHVSTCKHVYTYMHTHTCTTLLTSFANTVSFTSISSSRKTRRTKLRPGQQNWFLLRALQCVGAG